MQISFQAQGGIAAFPRLNRHVVLDTALLPAPDSSKLEGLVQATRFFDLPAAIGAVRRGAADFREYTVTIEDGNQHHTVHITEPFENPDLQKLIAELQVRVRAKDHVDPPKS
jgi:hypothetical protein